MYRRLLRCLGDDIPMEERIFSLATLLCAFFCGLYVCVALLFMVSPVTILLFFSIGVVSTISFFVNKKVHKPILISAIFLFYSNFIAFPIIMLLSPHNLIEVPLYSLVGLVFIIVLLKKALRLIYYFIEIVLGTYIAYYCFICEASDTIDFKRVDKYGIFSIAVAIMVTGLLCGFIIQYRNTQLETEMLKREEATKKAEAASAAKDTFLVNISHEIRTPLNAILGTTELLLDSNAPNHVRETAYNISNSSRALLSITTDLLDFSRMNSESLVISEEKYDVAFLLNDIINLMSVRLLDSNIEFLADIDPKLPATLIGDSGKIRQIMINLLSNAIKYTKEGYAKFSISFEHISSNEIMFHVRVEDTGIGIREENLEKIFEAYNRSGEATDRLIEGNGLGLSLCKNLATSMGGKIYAKSVYGEGSTFFFDVVQRYEAESENDCVGYVNNKDVRICIFADEHKHMLELSDLLSDMNVKYELTNSEADFFETIKNQYCNYYVVDARTYDNINGRLKKLDIDWKKLVVVSGCNYSYSGEPFEYVLTKPVSCLNVSDLLNQTKSYAIRKKKFNGVISLPDVKILVVDDNILNLDVAAGILQRYKPTVITATSGKEALITLQNEPVDIVYLDYMMPEMDGIDTLKEIRKLGKQFETLPVIALTANVVSGAKEMFINAGFDDYLSKPIEIDSLEKTLLQNLPSELVKYKL